MPPFSRGTIVLRIAWRRYPPRYPVQAPCRCMSLPSPRKILPQARKTQEALKWQPVDPENPSDQTQDAKTPSPSILERIKSQYRARWRPFLYSILRVAVWLPPILLIILHAPPQLMWVQGGSMHPYFNTHWSNDAPNTEDCVLVWQDKYAFPYSINEKRRRPVTLERGMIIVFHAPHDPERVAVKRIVGLPGDRVQPLPGYPGGPDPVVVPWNHLWVEGDVDNRNLSLDSNWYGPISQCLVIGRVTHVLGSYYRPSRVEWSKHAYPAQARVQKDAVTQADPDLAAWKDMYLHSRVGDRWLTKMRHDPEGMKTDLATLHGQRVLAELLRQSHAEMARDDPDTLTLATALYEEAEKWRRWLLVEAGTGSDSSPPDSGDGKGKGEGKA